MRITTQGSLLFVDTCGQVPDLVQPGDDVGGQVMTYRMSYVKPFAVFAPVHVDRRYGFGVFDRVSFSCLSCRLAAVVTTFSGGLTDDRVGEPGHRGGSWFGLSRLTAALIG